VIPCVRELIHPHGIAESVAAKPCPKDAVVLARLQRPCARRSRGSQNDVQWPAYIERSLELALAHADLAAVLEAQWLAR